MLIKSRSAAEPPSSDITPESVYLGRRQVLTAFGAGAVLAASPGVSVAATTVVASASALVASQADDPRVPAWLRQQVTDRHPSAFTVSGEALTPFRDVSTYNNFYEFGTGKSDPAENAGAFVPHPWKVRIDGAVDKPADYWLEDLLRGLALEERIYRLRCVEAWSMVVPWIGIPLSTVLKRAGMTSGAKFVAFETLHDPKKMPGQREPWLRWPYVEGLRIDEAMHPLTMLAVGVYGRSLPAQNGAPFRLIVPWKYGFKSIKSIVRISLVGQQPRTTWSTMAASEYGFYANVNPAVDHPRWSQKRERRLPNALFSPNWIETKPFNGYADEVASLYRGMDLRRFF